MDITPEEEASLVAALRTPIPVRASDYAASSAPVFDAATCTQEEFDRLDRKKRPVTASEMLMLYSRGITNGGVIGASLFRRRPSR